MLGERLLHRLAPLKAANLRRLLLRCSGFQLLELVDQPGSVFGAATILVALEHGDLEALDQRLGRRHHGVRAGQFGPQSGQFGTEFAEFRGGI